MTSYPRRAAVGARVVPAFEGSVGMQHHGARMADDIRIGLGQKLDIDPTISRVGLFQPEPVAGQRWIEEDIADILDFPADQFLLDADDDAEDLFSQVLERLGPTDHRTIYTFTPRVQEGGAIRADLAALADAATELIALRSLQIPMVGLT